MSACTFNNYSVTAQSHHRYDNTIFRYSLFLPALTNLQNSTVITMSLVFLTLAHRIVDTGPTHCLFARRHLRVHNPVVAPHTRTHTERPVGIALTDQYLGLNEIGLSCRLYLFISRRATSSNFPAYSVTFYKIILTTRSSLLGVRSSSDKCRNCL